MEQAEKDVYENLYEDLNLRLFKNMININAFSYVLVQKKGNFPSIFCDLSILS